MKGQKMKGQKIKGVLHMILLATAVVGSAAKAEISQECILEGRVVFQETTEDSTKVRVSFHDVKHGDQGRCLLLTRDRQSYLQFVADPRDQLHLLPNGAEVSYRFFEQDGQTHWELMKINTAIALN